MKKLIINLVIFLVGLNVACAQTTPNFSFNVPNAGTLNWSIPLNSNMNALDSLMSGSTYNPAIAWQYKPAFVNGVPSNTLCYVNGIAVNGIMAYNYSTTPWTPYVCYSGTFQTFGSGGGGAGYAGVTSDGSNGLTVTGKVATNAGLDISHGAFAHLFKTADATLGSGNQSNVAAGIQVQNFYALNSTLNAIANMYANTPSQLRVGLAGDSTTGFHNIFVLCTLTAKYGLNGYDLGGNGGVQTGYGQPCASGLGQTQNSSTGTNTQNNGAGSITPGTGAPYDYTRSPDGVVINIASGGSITFGSSGSAGYGNVLKVYYIKEPTDGIYGATPGTMTVTATSSASGACPSGCTIFTGSLSNGSSIGAVLEQVQAAPDTYTITVAASGGAIDIKAVAIYDNTTNGVISVGGFGRGGLSLPDSVSTPTAITGPWLASATAAPINITASSCTGSGTVTCTFVATNNLVTGAHVTLANFATNTQYNGIAVTVISTGLSSSQFEAVVSGATSSDPTSTGWALKTSSMMLQMFEMKQNGVTGTGCTQATTAAPTVFQPYSYWLGLYKTLWTGANSLLDMEFTSSYDNTVVSSNSCGPIFNEQERELAQTNGYLYFDNLFSASNAELDKYGMIGSSIHSFENEQLAHGMSLWTAMGLDSFLGAEQRPLANSYATTKTLMLGSTSPKVTPSTAVCNPSTTNCIGSMTTKAYTDSSSAAGQLDIDSSYRWTWWDYNHVNCYFAVQISTVGGTNPCLFQINTSSVTISGSQPITHSSTTSNILDTVKSTGSGTNGSVAWNLDRGSTSSSGGTNFMTNGTYYWAFGMRGDTTNDAEIYDVISSKAILNFPSNTMPANSIYGNSAGASLLTIQTNTNCSSANNPAVCSSAPSGSVIVGAGQTTETVDTTAVTANSQILIQFDSSLGTKNSVTCNTTFVSAWITARVAGTSFTITVSAAPTTNPACFSYTIVN